VICGPHRVLVVLHHDDGVAEIAQPHQGLDELLVVRLVETDAWLVQNIKHPGKARPELRGQTDPLTFPA